MEKSRHIELEEEKETNIGQQIISKYLPFWPLFILFGMLALAAAYVYLRYATPIYQASATIMIKDESRGGSEDGNISEKLSLLNSKKNIENEMEVLQSRGLMEKVVRSLHLYAPVSQEGKLKPGDAYDLSPVLIEARNPDSMQEALRVNFNYDPNTQT